MVRGEEALAIRQRCKTGLSISEIVRRTGRDRKTVPRVIRGEIPRPRPVRAARPGKLGLYKDYIVRRMEQGVTNAVRIRKKIREQGCEGGMIILRDFRRPRRPGSKVFPADRPSWLAVQCALVGVRCALVGSAARLGWQSEPQDEGHMFLRFKFTLVGKFYLYNFVPKACTFCVFHRSAAKNFFAGPGV